MKTVIYTIFSVFKFMVGLSGSYLVISRFIKSKEQDRQRNAKILLFKVFGILVILGIIESILVSFF
jgi:uncharacterized protein YhhL (DUF1145 family)